MHVSACMCLVCLYVSCMLTQAACLEAEARAAPTQPPLNQSKRLSLFRGVFQRFPDNTVKDVPTTPSGACGLLTHVTIPHVTNAPPNSLSTHTSGWTGLCQSDMTRVSTRWCQNSCLGPCKLGASPLLHGSFQQAQLALLVRLGGLPVRQRRTRALFNKPLSG